MPIYKSFLKEASTLPEERIEKLGTVKINGADHDVSRDIKMTRPAFGGHLMASIFCLRFRPAMATAEHGTAGPAAGGACIFEGGEPAALRRL